MKKGWWIILGLLVAGAAIAYFGFLRPDRQPASESDDSSAGTIQLKPKMRIQRIQFSDIDDETLNLNLTFQIVNPLPVGLKASAADFALYMDNTLVLEDRYAQSIDIQPNDSSSVTLPCVLRAKRLKEVNDRLAARNQDSALYRLRFTANLDVPVLGERTMTINTRKTYPVYHLLKMKVGGVDVEKFGLKESDVSLTLELNNQNIFPTHLKLAKYALKVDDKLIAEGSHPDPVYMKPESITPVDLPLEVKTGKFTGAAFKTLFAKKTTPFEIRIEYQTISRKSDDPFKNSNQSTVIRGTLNELLTKKKR
ncbi:hypothetical protein GCM10023189_28600 [Nibrella saemangeumensis]|uniref:Late embryogenesis abundant protein LEA-2 subgroup domain-containing protein n=1 Tax=Nibrella saemangeumensis TaxID=1084526 RepID=A0ABP8MX27_9BACT